MEAIKSRFTPQHCATCNGQGNGQDHQPCRACRGKGIILVLQPEIRCPRCRGTGKPEPGWPVEHCVVCYGTGWVWTEFHLEESSLPRARSQTNASS